MVMSPCTFLITVYESLHHDGSFVCLRHDYTLDSLLNVVWICIEDGHNDNYLRQICLLLNLLLLLGEGWGLGVCTSVRATSARNKVTDMN